VSRQSGGHGRRTAAAIAAVLVVAAGAVVILLATAAGGAEGGYKVRAIFDDAANLVSSEDVKIDGVKVGTVGAVVPTPEGKAAVTLNIEDPGFRPFRKDASCTIKPQALIGEKFVDCLPTQQRPEEMPLPGPLTRIAAGKEGAGEALLPLTNTSSPVGVDQLSDINRLPENQRFAIILDELGATFAGRGSDLNAVLHRSNPALRELEKVFGILASENKVLGDLAVEGDRALEPVARDRRQFAEFFAQSNTVSKATAAHRRELAENLREFPAFLREFGPYLARLEKLAEQATPTFTDLGVAARGIDRTFKNLGPFSESSTRFFESLGKSSKGIEQGLVASQPLLRRLAALGTAVKPFAGNFGALLSSFRETGGIERFMDFIFLGTNAENGYNSLGHFLRAVAVGTPCVAYKTAPTSGCSANFINTGAPVPAGTAAKASDTSLAMERVEAIAKGATVAQALAEYPGTEAAAGPFGGAGAKGAAAPATAKPVGGASSGTTYYTPGGESEAGGMLLNYLLGN
jgi:phospholipid/cholesterol/gamma-HCH transport system substrate-binding protein